MTVLLHEVQPRTFLIVIVAIFLITILGAYVYLFKAEMLEISRLRGEKHEILGEFEREKTQTAETQIDRLQSEIEELDAALYGQGGQMSPSQLVSYVISKLDGLSARHGIQLVSVRPDARNRIHLFEETPFAIEVKGSYRELYAWLRDAERELHPMIVKQFQISPTNRDGSPLTMALRFVSYRLLEEGI